MGNLEALNEFLTAREDVSPLWAELARSAAAAIDDRPAVGLAALLKEYAAIVERMLADDPDRADPFADLLAEMGNAQES